MMRHSIIPVLFGITLLHVNFLKAQEVAIKQVILKGGDIIINYDLMDEDISHRYVIGVYSSMDEFIAPLTEVEGDVGIDLQVGGNKKVIWHASKELGEDYDGSVSLEVKGRLYVPFVRLYDFDKVSNIKKGRPKQITWTAGRGSNVLTWDLFNSKNELVHTFTNIANVGEYEMVIPKEVKPGKGYYLRITDKSNKDDIVKTTPFKVSRKVPLYVNAGIALGAVALGAILIDNIGGSTGPGESGPDLIPDIGPPGN